MFTRSVIGALALVTTSTLTSTAAAEPTPNWGGFGHAFAGMFAGSFGNIADDLAKTEALGGAAINAVGAQLGGGGWVLLSGHFMVGGRGWGMYVPSEGGDRGSATFGGGGGGVDFGWAAYNRNRFLVFPFIGVGGYGQSIELNNSRTSVETGGGEITVGGLTIPAGKSATIDGGAAYMELGLGVQRFLFKEQGGFMLGAEIEYPRSCASRASH